MTMTTTTTRDGARPTLHLPSKADKAPPTAKTTAPPTKTLKIPKPLDPNRGALETNADVSPDLAPEHRKGPSRIKAALNDLARSLIELTADVPIEPRDTRHLRLALAVVELAPECPPSLITNALRAYALGADEAERVEANELGRAIHGSVTNARLARFRLMFESAISIIEARRINEGDGQ
jgi:hypothetical protein